MRGNKNLRTLKYKIIYLNENERRFFFSNFVSNCQLIEMLSTIISYKDKVTFIQQLF